jgi:transposase InsO family protein
VANKTDGAVEEAVVAARKHLDEGGLDAGAASIAEHLRAEGTVPMPSESTIYRILKARGFITAQPRKAPKSAGARFVTAARANECWGLDDTSWELADGTVVKILNVIDDHSRLLVVSRAMASCTGAATLEALAEAAAVIGWPQRFLSDNALAFRHTLAGALAAIGVAASHTRPRRPQSNGKVERFHQTLKKRLVAVAADVTTIDELQVHLDDFQILYNHHRPHRGIARQRPAQAWEHAPKSGPATAPLTAPTTVHRSTVSDGSFYAGTHLAIAVGAAHNGATALTIITGTTGHVFIDGQLIRQLDIDPTRVFQALHPRPGRPPTVRDVPRHP